MQVNLKNRHNNDTAHATVRMNAREYKELQSYMHLEGQRLKFPHGVKLMYRGRGWYKLVASRSHRAVEKLTEALKVLRLFCNWRDKAVVEALRAFTPVVGTALRVIAYTDGEFVYAASVDAPSPTLPKPSAFALSRLQQKFNHAKQ